VPAGRHHVMLSYRPRTIMWGLVVALGTLLVVLGLVAAGRSRSPRGGER
jgi:hypothetical protein